MFSSLNVSKLALPTSSAYGYSLFTSTSVAAATLCVALTILVVVVVLPLNKSRVRACLHIIQLSTTQLLKERNLLWLNAHAEHQRQGNVSPAGTPTCRSPEPRPDPVPPARLCVITTLLSQDERSASLRIPSMQRENGPLSAPPPPPSDL